MEKMKKKKKVLILVVIILSLIMITLGVFAFMISPVNRNEISAEFIVNEGDTYNSISDDLKKTGLIRNELFYKVYIKLASLNSLEAGLYNLSPSMNLCEIINTLNSGAIENRKTVSVTFVEGKNMRYIISLLVEKLGFKEDDILQLLKDTSYIDELISKYWFLTDEIKNENIYYSLEGYLYPDTYEFYEDVTIKEVFEKMLNNMDTKISSLKSEVENSNYTFHEMLTLASIVEQEAGTSNDRKGVAGVFYNRLEDNWSLGSDVTTYYAEKLELWSRDLYQVEISKCNSYNTRSSCMAGKLPIGPICNPSIDSITSVIEPTEHNYYYFVADINGETYFNETSSGHTKTVSKLKSEGKWYEYSN